MPARVALILGVFPLVTACGTFEAGLSNAPSINRQRPPISAHDAISNGPESCGNADGGSPLSNRVPPCNGQDPMQPVGR